MSTLAQTPHNHKPLRVYYAHLHDESGVLAKIEGTIYFMAYDSGILTAIEPDHCNWLTVLGEVGLADCQLLLDQVAGGYARLACTRRQEVR